MFKQSSIGLKYLVIFIIVSLLTGIIRIEIILNYTKPELTSIVRVSGYISLVIYGLFSLLIILLGFYITYLLFQKRADYTSQFTYGIQYFAIGMVAGEVLKLATVFILLKSELMHIDHGRLSDELMHTEWYKIQPFINLLAISAGILLFTLTIRDKSKKIFTVSDYLKLSVPPFILLCVASFVPIG